MNSIPSSFNLFKCQTAVVSLNLLQNVQVLLEQNLDRGVMHLRDVSDAEVLPKSQ